MFHRFQDDFQVIVELYKKRFFLRAQAKPILHKKKTKPTLSKATRKGTSENSIIDR